MEMQMKYKPHTRYNNQIIIEVKRRWDKTDIDIKWRWRLRWDWHDMELETKCKQHNIEMKQKRNGDEKIQIM